MGAEEGQGRADAETGRDAGTPQSSTELIPPSGMETAQDASRLCPSLVLAATAQSKIIPEGCRDGVCTRGAARASPGAGRQGGAGCRNDTCGLSCVCLAGTARHRHRPGWHQAGQREEQCPASSAPWLEAGAILGVCKGKGQARKGRGGSGRAAVKLEGFSPV